MYGMSPRVGYRMGYPRMRMAPPVVPMMAPPPLLPRVVAPPMYYGPAYYPPPPPPILPVPPLVSPFRRPRFGPRFY